MGTIVKICNVKGNENTGFTLSKLNNIIKLFPHGAQEECIFKLGVFQYKVAKVDIDGFYDDKINYESLDNVEATPLGTLVWVYCSSTDPRFDKEGQNYEDILEIINEM